MRGRVGGLLLAGTLLCAPLTAAAEELFPGTSQTVQDQNGYSEDGMWMYNDYGDGTFSVTCMDTEAVEVTVPSRLAGRTVTMIEVDAFKDCTKLETVHIPATVTVIEDYSFQECTALKSVEIPASVENIGFYAFYGCSSLEEVFIPASVKEIEMFAFEGCSSLKKIEVSDANHAYKAEDGVLFDIDGTTLIRYPSAKEDTAYTVPAGCTRIEDWAFIGNTYLEHVDLADVEVLGEEAFYYCTALREITVPAGQKSLDRYTFAQCQSLESVTLPEGLETLGRGCFYGCFALKSIDIPSTVTTIEDMAFFNCGTLKSITLTDAVTSIGERALGYYYDENDTYQKVPGFVIDARDDTQAFAYAAENSIRCTGGITEGTVFIYIVIGVVVLVILATIALVIAQRRIQKRHELI